MQVQQNDFKLNASKTQPIQLQNTRQKKENSNTSITMEINNKTIKPVKTIRFLVLMKF